MKKHIITLFILVIFTSNINTLTAQEEKLSEPLELRKFGLGLNFEKNIFDPNYYYWDYPPVYFTLSMHIKNKVRIEPEAGYSYVHYYDDYDETEEKGRTLSVGFGGYGLIPKNSVCIIYGGKLNYYRYLQNRYNNTEGKFSTNGFSFGPVAGVDYFISPHFAVGADFRLLYLFKLIRYDYDIDDEAVEKSSYRKLATDAGLKFRFYF